jgi:hypothetical protein
MIFLRTAKRTDGLAEPCQVIARAPHNRECNDFWNVVTVELPDRPLQYGKPFPRRFYDQQHFLRGIDIPLPAINGTHRHLENIHAGCQSLLHQHSSDSPGLLCRSARYQYYDFIRHGSPRPLHLYSCDSWAWDSSASIARGSRYNSRS